MSRMLPFRPHSDTTKSSADRAVCGLLAGPVDPILQWKGRLNRLNLQEVRCFMKLVPDLEKS